MKTNQEILDEFGQILVKSVFDIGYGITKNQIAAFKNTDGYKNLFKNVTPQAKKEFDKIIYDILDGALYNFLRIFEENEEFKLIHEEEGNQINLLEISEMLKAEPIIENGWIARFSAYKNSEESEI